MCSCHTIRIPIRSRAPVIALIALLLIVTAWPYCHCVRLFPTRSSIQSKPNSSSSSNTSSACCIGRGLTRWGIRGAASSITSSISSSIRAGSGGSSSRHLQQDDAFINARIIKPPPPQTHNIVHSFTPEAAEAVAYSDPDGIHRLIAPEQRRSYATVEPDPMTNNPNRDDSTVKTRARSNQDLPGKRNRRDGYNGYGDGSSGGDGDGSSSGSSYKRRRKGGDFDIRDSSSGNIEQPIMVLGGMSYAQTFQGATSVASSDSIALSKGGRPGSTDGTSIASSNPITWVPGLVEANVEQSTSVGVSSGERVGSLAASGAGDGHIALAQADAAVAMAQAETVEWEEGDDDRWHDPSAFSSGDWSDDADDEEDDGSSIG